MAVTLVRAQYANFTGNSVLDQSDTWLATTAGKLIVVITSRAYAKGATRSLTVYWGATPIPLPGLAFTNFTTPAVGSYDICYWIGELGFPSTSATTFRVVTDDYTRGLNCAGFFVNGAKSLNAAALLASQARDASGNTVSFTAAPAVAGSIVVNSTMIDGATTVTSFVPTAWTTLQSGTSGPAGAATSTIRYGSAADLSAITATTQFGASSVRRGGVLVEIQAEASAAYGVTESVTPADSVGPLVVATTMGLTEALSAGDGSSLSVPSNTSPENPVGVWTGAAASWKLPSGADSKGVNTLTVSGLSAATIKGPGAIFTAASYARRTGPALGSPNNLTLEFWCKPTTFGGLWYLGPRVSGTNSARLWIDTAGAWNLSRTTSAGTQSGKSSNGAAVLGQTYHVVGVFAAGADHKLYVNGEPLTLTLTGSALTGAFTVGSDDEVAIGVPTLASAIPAFAGSIGRVTLWPIAMSPSRVKASYRQQNDLDEWAGTSGENAISDANRAPAPAPVHADMTSGVAQTINVIARAYDPDGDALSIQAGSLTPSTGSASIVGDQVRWTPPASFTGAATCGFTLRDGGGKTGASKVYAQVAAPSSSPEYPALTGTARYVNSVGEFAAKYAAAVPGDHVILADGLVFPARVTLDRFGTSAGAQIVVRAANPPSANSPEFRGGITIPRTAPWQWLWGIRHYNRGGNFSIAANNIRVRRVLFYDQNTLPATTPHSCVPIDGNDVIIEYCEMHHIWRRGFHWGPNTKRGKLLRSYIHHFLDPIGRASGSEPIRFGDAGPDYDNITSAADGHEVGYLFMEEVNLLQGTEPGEVGGEPEAENPSWKLPYGYLHHAHFKNTKSPTNRYTHHHRTELVRCEGSKAHFINGGLANTYNSCWTAGNFQIQQGDVDGAIMPAPGGSHPSSVNTKLIGCKGRVIVGYDPFPDSSTKVRIPTTGTVIMGHISGDISGPDPRTISAPDVPILGAPPTYTAASQGLLADL